MTIKQTIQQIWTSKELRNSILFVLGMVVIIRLLAHIPIPGVNADNLKSFFGSNQILGLLNVFSGGSMERFSIIALGVGPYITASIIFQLLGMVFPKFEEMQKDGTAGQEKINQYTRLATVPMALLQSYAIIKLLQQSGRGIINSSVGLKEIILMGLTMTAGTILLMWLGELISERKVGNGISIIIFAGIIAGLPTTIQQAFISFDSSQIFVWVAYLLIGILTIASVVFMSEAQRNIPVVYPKHVRGVDQAGGGVETNLPLRINMAGVIPIIFAISLILFPSLIAQFFIRAKTVWLANFAQGTISLFQNQLFYGILYFVLVFAFTYFYTGIVFKADQAAENIQKQGGFIPGVRPGKPTADFLIRVINRIIPAGAFFLAIIAVLPIIVQQFTGSQNFIIGGTSMLIVVSVVIEIVNQVNSQLSMRDYETI